MDTGIIDRNLEGTAVPTASARPILQKGQANLVQWQRRLADGTFLAVLRIRIGGLRTSSGLWRKGKEEVLTALENHLRSVVEPEGHVQRAGADEFLLFGEVVDAEDAPIAALEIREGITALAQGAGLTVRIDWSLVSRRDEASAPFSWGGTTRIRRRS